MGKIYLGCAHDFDNQGASAQINGEMLTEYKVSLDIRSGISEMLRDHAVEHYVMDGTLQSRLNVITATDAQCMLALEPHMDNLPAAPVARGYYCIVHADCKPAAAAANEILTALAPLSLPRRKSGLCFVRDQHYWFGDGTEWDGHRLALLHTPTPAMIIECGVLSNQMDRLWFSSREHRLLFGNAIGRGVIRWLRGRKQA